MTGKGTATEVPPPTYSGYSPAQANRECPLVHKPTSTEDGEKATPPVQMTPVAYPQSTIPVTALMTQPSPVVCPFCSNIIITRTQDVSGSQTAYVCIISELTH